MYPHSDTAHHNTSHTAHITQRTHHTTHITHHTSHCSTLHITHSCVACCVCCVLCVVCCCVRRFYCPKQTKTVAKGQRENAKITRFFEALSHRLFHLGVCWTYVMCCGHAACALADNLVVVFGGLGPGGCSQGVCVCVCQGVCVTCVCYVCVSRACVCHVYVSRVCECVTCVCHVCVSVSRVCVSYMCVSCVFCVARETTSNCVRGLARVRLAFGIVGNVLQKYERVLSKMRLVIRSFW